MQKYKKEISIPNFFWEIIPLSFISTRLVGRNRLEAKVQVRIFATKLNYVVIMTDYEYIIQQVKKFHFTKWDENVLRECLSILPNLTRAELVSIYRSRLPDEKHSLKQTAFKVLFADKVGKREERIRNMPIDELIEEFKDKKSGNVALIRKELRERYKAGKDKQQIAGIFNVSTKSDMQWVKNQVRKEQYGDSNSHNYQWKKTSWI